MQTRINSLAVGAMILTVVAWVYAWPRPGGAGTVVSQSGEAPDEKSVQSCNTLCQEQQTNCALKCDQDADCIRGCRATAEVCVKQCALGGRDAGVAIGRDAG